jgi:hypothetical protein
MFFGAAGLLISLASYINGRVDAHRMRKEDEKRTKMVNDYLKGVGDKPFTNVPQLQAWSLRHYKRKVSDGNQSKIECCCSGTGTAGAPASVILDQFLNEKEGNSLTAYKDGGGIWTICRGATMVDGKPVVQGMKLTQAKCNQVNAIERDKALAWVDRNITVPLTEPQKAGIASFARTTSGRVNASRPRSISASMPVTGKGPVKLSAGGLKTVGVIAD